MSDFFIGEIKIMAFSFAPRFWAQCNGQLLPINQNQALFALLGTQYGGNGHNQFCLAQFSGAYPTSFWQWLYPRTSGGRRKPHPDCQRNASPHPRSQCLERQQYRGIAHQQQLWQRGSQVVCQPEQWGDVDQHRELWRFATAQQHAAVFGTEFLYCPTMAFSQVGTSGGIMSHTICWRNSDVWR